MYKEFTDYTNEELGSIRGLISNGRKYLAGEDILKILDESDRGIRIVLAEVPGRYKRDVTVYSRDKFKGLEDVEKRTYLDENGVKMLIDSSLSYNKTALYDWIIGEIYPDMREIYARDVETELGSMEHLLELYDGLEEKDKMIIKLSRQLEFIKNFLADNFDGEVNVEKVFREMETV